MNIHLFYSLGLFTVMLAAGGHAWAAPSTVDLLEEKGREAWSQLEELRKELIEKEDRRLSAYEIQVKLRTWMRGFTDNERDAFSKGLRKAAMEARVPGTVLEPIMHAFEALNTERLLRQEPMEEAENATGVIKTTDSPERKSRAAWRWLQGRDEKKVLSSREDLKAGLTAWMRDLAYNERPVFIRSLVEAAKRAGASEAVIATIKQATSSSRCRKAAGEATNGWYSSCHWRHSNDEFGKAKRACSLEAVREQE